MVRKHYTKYFLFILFILLITSITACTANDKKTTTPNNANDKIKQEKSDIQKNIELGDKSLQEGNFDNAKNYFEKAISIDTSNKQTYLDIKDKYLAKGRLDDAYYIIKLALNNNVDTSNMTSVLEEIKSQFPITTIEKTIYQLDSYSLPDNVLLSINGKEVNSAVKWSTSSVDTSKVGIFNYYGSADQYGRPIKLTLTVKQKPIVKNKIIGSIKQVYESNGKRYLKVDEVAFYTGTSAQTEAKKMA